MAIADHSKGIDDLGKGDVCLPKREIDDLQLVDSNGRIAIHGRRSRIDPVLQPILAMLGLTRGQWIATCRAFREHYRNGDLRLDQTA